MKTILVSDTHAFEKEVSRLNKKAFKIGYPNILFRRLGEKQVTRTSVVMMDGEESMRSYPVTVMEYEIELPSLEQYRWNLVATVTPVEGEKAFVDRHSKVTFDVAPYESNPCRCQHCNSNRHRSLTYIVQNKDDGRLVQVGRNCFADYVGVKGLEMLEFQSLVCSIFGEGEDGFVFPGGPGGQRVVEVRKAVEMAEALAIVMGGWRNNQRDDDTGELIAEGTHRLASHLARRTRRVEEKIDAKTRAKVAAILSDPLHPIHAAVDAALAEIKEIDFGSEDDDFGRTLQYCANFEVVPEKRASTVAYLCQFLRNRKHRLELEARKATMKHVGTVGKREDFRNLKIVKIASFESQFGVTYINIFEDANGNQLVWRTSCAAGNEGETVSLKGTVKEHSNYNGTLQTVLSRCKML